MQNDSKTHLPKRIAIKKQNAPAKKATAKKEKKVTDLPPDDLPLSDEWLTIADLVDRFQVKRGVIYRYRIEGILRAHKWGGTVRFNKTYVDWMIQNGGKFAWLGWLLAVSNNFDWLMDWIAA